MVFPVVSFTFGGGPEGCVGGRDGDEAVGGGGVVWVAIGMVKFGEMVELPWKRFELERVLGEASWGMGD